MSIPPKRRWFRASAYSLRETLLLVVVDAGVLASVVFTVVQWVRS